MIYPVYEPYITNKTKDYVNDCIDSTWISSKGKYVERFEEMISNYCGVKYGVSVFNGTVALHLALLALDIGPGDEVIVPDFTYIASANAVRYVGATPVLVDVSREDWNIKLEDIKNAFTEKTKAIMIVDVYGAQPKELDLIAKFAKEKNVYLVQDSAESLGSTYSGNHIGNYSDVSTLSFFGNKTVTTGEGGMVLTNNEGLYKKMKKIRNQGNSETERYYHDILGYNFRMTNIQAAIGCSQMEEVDSILAKKKEIFDTYKKELQGVVEFQDLDEKQTSSYWLVSGLISVDRTSLMAKLDEHGIETRPFFKAVSSMPFYDDENNPNTRYLSENGISFPSYPGLTIDDVKFICKKIKECVGEV